MSLNTRGAIFDPIVAFSKPISDSLDARDISTWFEVCVRPKGPYIPTQQDLSKVLWRTLIVNTYNSSPSPDSMRKAFKYWICAHLAMSAAQKLNLGFTEECAWSHFSALLRSAPPLRRWKGQNRISGHARGGVVRPATRHTAPSLQGARLRRVNASVHIAYAV